MVLLALAGCLTELPELADPCARVPEPGLYKLSFEDEGRSVLVNLPDTTGPRPVVMMLHGFGSSAAKMRDVTRYAGVGEDEGFVAVFPNGYGAALGISRSWNAGECCPPSSKKEYDDLAFLDKVVTTLESRVCADPGRSYAAGFSNGAMMAMRMGCESQEIDGIVAAAGSLLVDSCTSPAVPTMLVHGLADQTVLFEGGTSKTGDVDYPSSDDSLAVYLEKNGCDREPRIIEVGAAVCEEYTCDVPVRRCTLAEWDHKWPGGVHTPKAGFNLTRQSWAFFEGQPLD